MTINNISILTLYYCMILKFKLYINFLHDIFTILTS